MQWDLTLRRISVNRLNEETTRKKLRMIAGVASRNQALKFTGKVSKLKEPTIVDQNGSRNYVYTVKLRVEKENVRDEEKAKKNFKHILNQIISAAKIQKWVVLDEQEEKNEILPSTGIVDNKEEMEDGKDDAPREPFEVPELNDEVMASHFSGIYERDYHIRIIHDSVKSYISSMKEFEENPSVDISRSHILLKGKPAGCKTTLFERFKQWYEDRDGQERVLFVDGPTMSKAGLENFLLDRARDGLLPEIMVFEEIEKQDPNNLLTLVSVMGSGYVSKLNARVGHRKELANILVWATCNEEEIIKNFRNGVLWSRFAHKLHCTRPSQELLQRIMLDKVNLMGGNPLWVERVLEFAFVTLPKCGFPKITDPREIKGLLDGRDRLLDGSYQQDLIEILNDELEEKKLENESC